jgi:hypothetical protein
MFAYQHDTLQGFGGLQRLEPDLHRRQAPFLAAIHVVVLVTELVCWISAQAAGRLRGLLACGPQLGI